MLTLFGGAGNNRRIHAALALVFAQYGYLYTMPFYFPSIGEYASLLELYGFEVKYALLFDRPTVLVGEDGLKVWMQMFLKTPFAAVASASEREAMLHAAQESLRASLFLNGKWYADYVRIRMKALRM